MYTVAIIGGVCWFVVAQAVCAEGWRDYSNGKLKEWLQERSAELRTDKITQLLGEPDQKMPGSLHELKYEGNVWIYKMPAGRSLCLSEETCAVSRTGFEYLKAQLVVRSLRVKEKIAWTVRPVPVYEFRQFEFDRLRRIKGHIPSETDFPDSKFKAIDGRTTG